MVFPARQMIFDVICDLIADRRQRKQFGFNERIVGLLDKFPTHGRFIPQIVKPIMNAEHGTVELGVVIIHGGAFTGTPNAVFVTNDASLRSNANMLISYAADIGMHFVNTT